MDDNQNYQTYSPSEPQPYLPQWYTQPVYVQRANNLSTTGMVLGIIAVLFPVIAFMFSVISSSTEFSDAQSYAYSYAISFGIGIAISIFGKILSVAAIVLGTISMKRSKFAGLSISRSVAGIVCGIIAIAYCLGTTALLGFAWSQM